MNQKLDSLLENFVKDDAGIYKGPFNPASNQQEELKFRQVVASINYENYHEVISRSHSIPVMDYELQSFLLHVPINGIILDIGGCWGWHWRKLSKCRPDVNVLIIDFVRDNLLHAKNILGDLVGSQVVLMHADAMNLPFKDNQNLFQFDAIWTVQTLQHIPNFSEIINRIYESLIPGGAFINYSLNIQPPIRAIYSLFGKHYHLKGVVEGEYYLERATIRQKTIIENKFRSEVQERWSEILFSPELLFSAPGKDGSFLGWLDARLSNDIGLLSYVARQYSMRCKKNVCP